MHGIHVLVGGQKLFFAQIETKYYWTIPETNGTIVIVKFSARYFHTTIIQSITNIQTQIQ